MKLDEKLQMLRKQNGYSQEQLAEKLGIARQTVSKWETGQAVPELSGLILLSELYGITIDRIVKPNECNIALCSENTDQNEFTAFLIRAKRSSYAGNGCEVAPSRTASRDYAYNEGAYYDTYLGSEMFAGQEAVWHDGTPIWCMNYVGRVTGEHFSGDFLKEALCHVTADRPFRGPEIYVKGEYHYHCRSEGDVSWYEGYEEIFYADTKIYECRFHGGKLI